MLAKQACVSFITIGRFFIGFIKQGTPRILPFWMLSWAIIPHLCGVHYWQLRILSIQGQDGQLEMAEMYQWHPTLGYLTHRFSWIPHHKIWRLLIWSTRTLGNGIGGKLFATYDRRTCESILALPLTHQNSHDKLIWKENRSQRFTVRSAYQVALRLKYPNQAEHSSVQAHVRVHLEEAMEVKRTTKGPYLPMEGMLRMSTHKGESPQKTDQSRRKMRAVPSP